MPAVLDDFGEIKARQVDNDDPSKCYVCKEAAGKHSYYGRNYQSYF
jgi:protein-arginine kinase activator protein McsA